MPDTICDVSHEWCQACYLAILYGLQASAHLKGVRKRDGLASSFIEASRGLPVAPQIAESREAPIDTPLQDFQSVY